MKNFMEYEFNVEKIRLSCFVRSGQGALLHKNRPSHGLVLYLNGAEGYDFGNGKPICVKAGDIIYLPKGADYAVGPFPQGSCYAINFDISEQVSFEPFVFRPKNAVDMLATFRLAEKTWKMKNRGYAMKCKELLYHVICQLQTEYHAAYISQSKIELIAPALTRIHESYTTEQLRIGELAEMCKMTPEYFRSIFRKYYQVSPLKYINDLKLTHAAELITSGEYSITEVAGLSGFTDASHFSREFKKHFGVPPVEYKG
ncbi:MAG: helix-turn-helix domain-containing protein [Ruminococcaceae bacterium]|nr:helix-turn-helix domain-containing protein [Oscillospiraceae bacterium]